MFRFLIRPSATLAFIEALALLFAISWLDLATGHQVSLVLFIPHRSCLPSGCDNKSVFVIAGLAGVLWSWADLVLGHSYSNGAVQGWEIAIRFAFFFLVDWRALPCANNKTLRTRASRCLSTRSDSKSNH